MPEKTAAPVIASCVHTVELSLSGVIVGALVADCADRTIVDFVVRVLQAVMASASANKGLSGKKQQSPEDLLEHATHLELENRFLEARVKTLEEDGRKHRLKIDDLRRELRERTEALEKERLDFAICRKDNQELIASHPEVIMMLKWRKAIEEKRALRATDCRTAEH
ncbi:hypothetical protein R1sor_024555 [Riccia sorocarpa]|uniref:Uncharacterized protein n=1 Tax=Riccia sorocarpa TaxID=122646 RepID=A0ABD3GTA1_9MARC